MGETIIKWHNKGYLLGPFEKDDPQVRDCRINPAFCVPKPDAEVRPVINYSKEIKGSSLNDLLYPEWCSVKYISIQQIVFMIKLMGIGALMWAQDLEDGYFNLRVKPSHAKLMAFSFSGLIFIPLVLAFGLSTAPLIFTIFMGYVLSAIRFSDPSISYCGIKEEEFPHNLFPEDLGFIIRNGTVYFPLVLSYLDDIFGVNRGNAAWKQFYLTKQTLNFLDLSVKLKKDRPPATVQMILGLEFDSIKQEVRTPMCKVIAYQDFASKILQKKKITKKQLFSLTGKVRHAAGQCKPLAAYARGVEIYGHKIKHWHHRLGVNISLKRDIMLMMKALNITAKRGTSFNFILDAKKSAELQIFSDATSRYGGIGAFLEKEKAPWIQVHWKEVSDASTLDIEWKELAAIVVAIMTFKQQLRNKHILVWTDNDPVKWMLIKWRAKLDRPDLQGMIRFLAGLCIEYNINPWWEHIEGENNCTADALSRFKDNPWEYTRVLPNKRRSPAKKHLQYLIDNFSR